MVSSTKRNSVRRRLADSEAHGDVAMCGQCQDVHIRWDNLMLSLSREKFEAFSRMITQARSGLSRGLEAASTRMTAPEAWTQ